MATGTPPSGWLAESDEMLATVIDIFRVRAAAMAAARNRQRG